MKHVFCMLTLTLALASCGKKASQAEAGANEENTSETAGLHVEGKDYNPKSFLLTEKTLPKQVDLSTDISEMTYAELRLMKSYVYAVHGFWFLDEEVNKFFQTKCEWYEATCYDYLEKHDWKALLEYDKAGLSAEEQAFVDKIDQRMKEMEKFRAVKSEDIDLLNPALTVNMFQLDNYQPEFYERLNGTNFCITPSDMQQLFNVYEVNDYQCMPNYITTDVYLQVFHMYFSYVLKSLERHNFTERLHKVCQLMNQRAMEYAAQASEGEIRNLAEFNAAFFAVADRLLTGKEQLPVPESYGQKVAAELRNIQAEQPTASSMMPWLDVYFNYDLFRPRGHYTRNEAEQRYFRAMMWLQTCTFCRESQQATKYAAMMAYIIRSYQTAGTTVGEDVSETLSFLMGEPDNVSVFDMAKLIGEGQFTTLNDLTDDGKLKWLDEQLKVLFQTHNRITPKVVLSSCSDKINYMPQRYSPDAEILNQMYDETPNAKHAYPSGLDVFAAFGSAEADNIINKVFDVPAQWKAYKTEAEKMKQHFSNYDAWDNTMYNKWIECLVTLQHEDKNQPAYMQTSHWQRKNLNTALASWGELKHDAVLYSEQPFAAECGAGSEFPDPILVGYIEPNIQFWKKMRELLTLTRQLLEKHALMDKPLDERTTQLENLIDFCIKISEKELAGTTLEENEYNHIKYMGSELEWYTLSIIDPDVQPDGWELVKGPERSIALVTDVFTRNIPECEKDGILYEATGNADVIYVLVDIGGKTYLTRGATFSYYEFVNPIGQRLTDEEWQQRLEKGDVPERPKWMQPYIINSKPTVNEGSFYGSGC